MRNTALLAGRCNFVGTLDLYPFTCTLIHSYTNIYIYALNSPIPTGVRSQLTDTHTETRTYSTTHKHRHGDNRSEL